MYTSFFKKVGLLLALALVLDLCFGAAFSRVFSKQKSGKYFTTEYALEATTEEVVVFGNSHAAQNFNVQRMGDSLGCRAFNFGNQNQSVLYYQPVIKAMLERHKPKLLILCLDAMELVYDRADYERLNVLVPFFGKSPYIDGAITTANTVDRVRCYSNFYKYNSTIGYSLMNTFKPTSGKSLYSRGYDPQTGVLCDLDIAKLTEGENKDFLGGVDTCKLNYLNDVIRTLKQANVPLMVVTTPNFEIDDAVHPQYEAMKKVLADQQVWYSNHLADARFVGRCEMFNDLNHLNEKGADYFSDLIVSEVRGNGFLFGDNIRYGSR